MHYVGTHEGDEQLYGPMVSIDIGFVADTIVQCSDKTERETAARVHCEAKRGVSFVSKLQRPIATETTMAPKR